MILPFDKECFCEKREGNVLMAKRCVICNCEVFSGFFSTKDKFEIRGGFVCRTCAEKLGINSMWNANKYTVEKARKKYCQLYPEEIKAIFFSPYCCYVK